MAVILIFLSWLVTCHGEFADEIQGYEKSCLGEDKFLCLDGSCISQEQYCDGNIDCMDASDESFCPDHAPDPNYCNATSHFLCTDKKKCIPNPWICNGLVDCDDGSDEVNCSTEVTTEPAKNTTCKGFRCDKTKCISTVWTCDGVYDCFDKTDESQEVCKVNRRQNLMYANMFLCRNIGLYDTVQHKDYRCIDSSFCLPHHMMCDGMVDCRDGSDEGPFCKDWDTVCSSNPCHGNDTHCVPERFGFSCICPRLSMQQYNFTTDTCEDVDECANPEPYCSQICINHIGHYLCECEEGYTLDEFRYLCHASGPEAMLFYSTKSEIGYVKVKSKERLTVATGIKQGHGVAYDGKYLYWVETAQGHQAIMRAQLDSVEETTEVLVGLGLEDPGDVAVDWLGGHIYFSDAERAIISVCRTDGSICTTLPTHTKSPKFVTLDVRHGKMYWADWQGRPVIMTAHMDGSHSEILVDRLSTFATGLTVDGPGGRLYYVDHTIQAVKLDTKQSYPVFEHPFNHPYSIAVFENIVYWSDWTSRSIQTFYKMRDAEVREQLVALDAPVFDMHIYHPVLVTQKSNPCSNHNCSHLCLVSSNTTHTCACPDGMELKGSTCHHMEGFRPQYLVVGGGSYFTRIQYNSLGNPETHATHFNIGWVHAMAYDSVRDTLYVYDGQRKMISSINMTDFNLGVTHTFIYNGLVDVVDMDYDYASDSLYILDAGKRFIEVVNLKSNQRALLYRFRDMEIPISFCVMPDYGKMLVAIRENEYSFDIHIDSIGLDGSGRKHLVMNDLRGPRVRLRYAYHMDSVYLSDEGNNIIDYMSPEGSGREHFRSLSTSITGLSVTDSYVFWTDRRTQRLFWADVQDITHRVRRIELSIFSNSTQLHIQATSLPPNPNSSLMNHPCRTNNPCSHICVQTPHSHPPKAFKPFQMGYKCLCPPSLLLVNGQCTKMATCNFERDFYCHKSNNCVLKSKRCDGNKDCKFGEDEELCDVKPMIQPGDNSVEHCPLNHVPCNGECIDKNLICTRTKKTNSDVLACEENQFHCNNYTICLEHSQLCDGQRDCPDDEDEAPALCDTFSCQDSEFMCTSGSCILSIFRCDNEEDCPDGSDEENCGTKTCSVGQYQCQNKHCVEIRQRCDGTPDCLDNSDEQDCEEPITEKDEVLMPHCPDTEYTCELNTSICLPAAARCNLKADCPGGTDELNCDRFCAPRGQFHCQQEHKCVSKHKICNGIKDCNDGSDEASNACAMVNRTSFLYPSLFPSDECSHGYLCGNGECLEWRHVCDGVVNCFDSSDENGHCEEACKNHTCESDCQPTPKGPVCNCPLGLKLDTDNRSCADIDECASDVCSQNCHNVPGTFLCSCYHGYALRLDRRSCKAIHGSMSILYVSGNSVRSLSADGTPALQYNDQTTARIVDIDADVRRNKIIVALPDALKLVEVNGVHNNTVIMNIGTPTRVAVDWVTGNVYFLDRGTDSYIRVCNVDKRRCAKLHKLPLTEDAKVTALVVDPGSRRMFYCVTRDGESVVWSASLAGQRVADLATFGNCTGLAVDSFGRKLYVAETGPSQIIRMNFEGDKHQKVLFGHPHLEAPQGLAIFEDWIYFLVANSLKLSRCQLYGKKTCEPYIYRMFDANTFVIRHNSVQRDDLTNVCDGFVCSNICVLDEAGPQCLCDDGTLAKDGECVVPEKSLLPIFNGWTHEEYTRVHQVSFTIVTSVLVLFVIYLAVFIYYQFKKRRRASNYVEVRFQNTSAAEQTSTHPVIEFPTSASTSTVVGASHEFVNPLEFVRKLWNRSTRRTRPIGTAGLDFNVSNTEDLSDTESDLDDRDTARIIK